MIFLQPLGGLCNRLRTLDSVIDLCEKYERELTVFWVNNAALTAPFDELFELEDTRGVTIKLIDAPVGFPDLYRSTGNRVKNFLKGRKLTGNLSQLLKTVKAIPESRIIWKDDLQKLYDSGSLVNSHSVDEMDARLYPLVQDDIERLFSGNAGDNVYITSCYRLSPVLDAYKKFEPTAALKASIEHTTSSFTRTIGLHIRKSDHETSKKFSTTEKFVGVIEKEISNDSQTTFFISTDDEATKTDLIDKYGDRIRFNEVSSYERDSPEAVKDAVVDLYCLAATSRLYGSHHSSFSQVAAIIGGIQATTVM
jgi:hypothetical protein